MIPFKVDPSWYERYWWNDPAPDRTACRADKANRERLLPTAGAMKVAINRLFESCGLRRNAVVLAIVDSHAQRIEMSPSPSVAPPRDRRLADLSPGDDT